MALLDHTKIPLVGNIFKLLDSEDINYGGFVLVLGIFFIVITLKVLNLSEGQIFAFIFATVPLWLPYLTFNLFFGTYMFMVGLKFRIKSGRKIFEIVLPPEVFKSPEAMEFVFTQIFNKASPDNLMETYLDGKRPLPYTFELVSKGGDVRFYATLPEKNTYGLRDAMYSQYPGVELRELDIDYTAEIPSDLSGWAFMSFHMNKKKDSEIPIKTYVEFGMDKLPKEEQKVDPMTPMLEMLSGIKPNQQMWIQFILIAHREQEFKLGQLHKQDSWEGGVYKKIDEMMGRDTSKSKMDEDENPDVVRLTPGERDLISAMERNVGKYAYEFNCRVVYLSTDPRNYDGGLFSRFLRSFAATEVVKRNGLGMKWRTDFNYRMFSDPFGKIIPALKQQELREYKQRILVPKTSGAANKIMTVEELATIFHLPGTVALTPTLNRVQSNRGEAPTNLPTGNLPKL